MTKRAITPQIIMFLPSVLALSSPALNMNFVIPHIKKRRAKTKATGMRVLIREVVASIKSKKVLTAAKAIVGIDIAIKNKI